MKTAVVTGGAKGIGLGTVRELLAGDWRCAIFDADSAGQAVADELGCDYFQVDVTRPEELRRAFADVAGRFGPLHGLVNSAGINRTGPSAELAIEDWKRVIDVDLSGTFYRPRIRTSPRVPRSSTSRRFSRCGRCRGASPIRQRSTAWSGSPGSSRWNGRTDRSA